MGHRLTDTLKRGIDLSYKLAWPGRCFLPGFLAGAVAITGDPSK